MPKPNPKDPEHLKLKLWFFEATASGPVAVLCAFALAVLILVGRAIGLW